MFAEEDGFGFGKRYPGGTHISVNGKQIPLLCAVSENASVNGRILTDAFRLLDDEGIPF